jgi:dihydroxy-acid dehydratase
MREMLSTTAALYGQGMGDKVALITGRAASPARRAASASAMSGRRRRSAARSRSCGTATSSPSTRSPGTLEVHLSDEELARRRAEWTPRATAATSGYLWKYTQTVGSALGGAVTHPGGSHEIQAYADL